MSLSSKVVVIGGGPVGAVAALRLAQLGIDVTLLEQRADCPEDMRASTFHPPTLEMMQQLGLLDALDADGLRAPVYQYRNRRSGNVLELDMGEIADLTPYPWRLQCEQYKLARLATQALSELPNGRVLFQRRLLSFEQDTSGVSIHIESPLEIEHLKADYLIAADGSSSTVRKWLNVAFSGFTYPERFLTLSTAYPLEQHFDNLAKVNYISDADEWCVILRVPTLWRILVPARGNETDAELLSDARKDSVLHGLTGTQDEITTYHRTLYRVHQRVADNFRHGRVLLVGDAAHLNNPLGGFGMNSGIHDAWNLCEKLRRIYQEGADADRELDHYDRQRRTIAMDFVQAQTISNKKAMESPDANGVSEMESHLARMLKDDAARRTYMERQAMIQSLRREAEIV